MEKNQVLNLTFASSLTDLCELNSSFDKATLRIAYAGKNKNRSSISKDVFEKCINTMYNCPIVCNYDRDTDSLGGHDVEVVRKEDGSLSLINVTTPIGCVPESAKYWWETVAEDDGTEHEYLYTEVLIWKRQEAYKKIKRDGITNHSMEIQIKDGELVDGYMNIYDFEFTAFCLIGVTPCFESSALVFAEQDFKQQLTMMMQDLKDSFKEVTAPEGVDDIHPQKYSMEGGEKVLDEKMKLLVEYGIDVDSLEFSIDDFTLDELKEKLEAMKADNNSDNDPVASEEDFADNSSNGEEQGEEEKFALTQQIVDEIRRELESEKVETGWGYEARYCYIDCDFNSNEVFAYDISDWFVYGFNYTVNGDAITVDFNSKKRKKFAIVDFEGDDQIAAVASVFARAEQAIKDNAGWETKYNTASETITSINNELAELRKFKEDTEAAEADANRRTVLEKFKDLEGIEAFESLKENCGEYDLDTLEEKCFALRGRYGMKATFSAETPKAPKLIVSKTDTSEEPYGGVIEKYLGNIS